MHEWWNGERCAGATTPDERAALELHGRMHADMDRALPRRSYEGTVVAVVIAYDADVQRATELAEPFPDGATMPLQTWLTKVAMQGAAYDRIQQALAQADPTYFTPQQLILLQKLCAIGAPPQPPCDICDAVRTKWREARDERLTSALQRIVPRYATAVLLARRRGVAIAPVLDAEDRLAEIEDDIGPKKMAALLERVVDPTGPTVSRPIAYTPGAFARRRVYPPRPPPPPRTPAALAAMGCPPATPATPPPPPPVSVVTKLQQQRAECVAAHDEACVRHIDAELEARKNKPRR